MDLSGGRFPDGKGRRDFSGRAFAKTIFWGKRDFFAMKAHAGDLLGNGFHERKMDATPTNDT